MEESLLRECKEYINANKFEEFQEFYRELTESDWANLYQKVYLHACLKKNTRLPSGLRLYLGNFLPLHKLPIANCFFMVMFYLGEAHRLDVLHSLRETNLRRVQHIRNSRQKHAFGGRSVLRWRRKSIELRCRH